MHTGNIVWESQLADGDKLGPIMKAAFSPTSDMLVCCHGGNTIISIWSTNNAQTWSLERGIDNESAANCLNFSTDGSLLVTGSKDALVRIWDVQTWKRKQDPIVAHEEPILCIAFSPNGMEIATGSLDGIVRLWNARTGKSIGSPMAGHVRAVRALAWSPDGSTLASGSDDGSIILQDTGTHSMKGKPLKGNGWEIRSLAFTDANDQEPFLLAFDKHSNMLLWDTTVESPPRTLLDGDTLPSNATDFSISQDGTHSTIAYAGRVMVVDISLDAVTSPSAARQQWPIYSVEFSPNDSIIASVGTPNGIDLWTREGNSLPKLPLSRAAVFTRFSHDGQLLASGDTEGIIQIWKTVDWCMVQEIKSNGRLEAAAWSLDGSHLAAGVIYDEHSLLICRWNPHTGQLLGKPIREATHMFDTVRLSADGRTLAAASRDDCTVRLWDVETGKQIGIPLTGHTRNIRAIAFSPDGSKLVTGGSDRGVRMWDLKTWEQLFEPIMHGGGVRSIAFSPDGKLAYYAGHDLCIHAFNSDTGCEMGRTLKGHTEDINSISISNDGKHIVSGGNDGTIRLWDRQTFSMSEVPLKSSIHCGLSGPNRVPKSIDQDGWIRTSEGGLVLWVPMHYRDRIWDMSLMHIPNEPESRPIRVKWEEICVEEEWVRVYSP